jgi:dTDP-4-amino-4,6-dideoxygalactose transaminase
VQGLEERAERVLAPGRHVLATGSGTAALASAYAALGLSAGAEVLVPTLTFRATVTPLLQLGLVPVLVDADPATGGLDVADAAARLSPRTEALVITHLWGRPADPDAARAFADRHRLALVEDCSHAHGTRFQGRPVGSVGDAAVWSVGTTKMASGGLGGILAAPDPALIERAAVFGQPKHRTRAKEAGPVLAALAQTGVGHNLRPSPVHAVLAADHLDRLAPILGLRNTRQHGFESLLAASGTGWETWARAAGHTHGALYKWHARHRDPEHVVEVLARAGVRARRPAPGLHRLPAFCDPDLARALLPRALRPVAQGPFPGADHLTDTLVEFDARDAYDPDADPLPGYAAALERAAAELTQEAR